MKMTVKLKNNKRIADLHIGTKIINLPIKVINTTEMNYTPEIHGMGDKEFKFTNPVREVVIKLNVEKLEALTVRGESYRKAIVSYRTEREKIGGEITLLEFQLDETVKKLTFEQATTLVELALASEYTDIKIPDRKMSLEEYKKTFLTNSDKILKEDKRVWGYIDIKEKPKLFKEKANFLRNSDCFGICFHFRVLNTNAENYLFVFKEMKSVSKWMHLTSCETRDWRFEKKTSIQNLLGVIFDSVSLRKYGRPPMKDGQVVDIPKEKAMLFSEADGGFYLLSEHQAKYGSQAEFISEAGLKLFEDLPTMDDILSEFSKRHKMTVIIKVFNALAVSSELNKFAKARRQGIDKEAEYINSKTKIKEGLEDFIRN